MLTVYSKDHCPFCTRAKTLLESKGVEFEEVRVDLDPEAKQFIVDAGHRSVPQIYLNGKIFVEGGYTGLAALDNSVFQQLKENINVN
ncbi:GrxC Glutaredoxin and related proteins [uncultured Caudovirales phage]|jgi:glutaredoxin 3|uniref:GrxC Glutaredoxin and related proteins n=1 Tax=uncultured Caudovirales phage TaxID=2100421 RepID=A0A6J5T196_9CAUD|nr:GrxC Glutaredoxin and related proteins [uncultured Caudovirales phage]